MICKKSLVIFTETYGKADVVFADLKEIFCYLKNDTSLIVRLLCCNSRVIIWISFRMVGLNYKIFKVIGEKHSGFYNKFGFWRSLLANTDCGLEVMSCQDLMFVVPRCSLPLSLS